jgi:hypothetical protein
MKSLLEFSLMLSGLVAFLAWVGVRPAQTAPAQTIILPAPAPAQPQEGRRLRRPHHELVGIANPAPDGTEPAVDYPDELWFKNIGSKIDGAGMCVDTAWEFSCRWAGLDLFKGFRDWAAAKEPGGGYPEKLARQVREYCAAKQIPRDYFDPSRQLIQYEGDDPTFIDTCLRNGWLPICTLYHSDRYKDRNQRVLPIIFHMTNAAALTDAWGCTLDNNFQPLEWKPRVKWLADIQHKGKYWAAVPAVTGPPPPPTH